MFATRAKQQSHKQMQFKPVPKAKFCKICFDTGKSEKEYTSHYVRETPDKNSKVVCPTLLAIECRYCFECGHTVKECPKLKQRGKAVEDAPYLDRRKRSKEATSESSLKRKRSEHNTCVNLCNKFDCLSIDDVMEVNSIMTVSESAMSYDSEFPAIIGAQDHVVSDAKMESSYLTALLKDPPIITEVSSNISVTSELTTLPRVKDISGQIVAAPKKSCYFPRAWADYSDSEDDMDEEMEEEDWDW